jgi:lipoprotein-anchoring transpeptidase ErfK/SrfK
VRKHGATLAMTMDQRIRDMCPLASARRLTVPFLALTLVFPANAQSNSDPSTKTTGTVSAQAQSMPRLASPNLAIPKTASNPIILGTKSAPASDGSSTAQPLSNPGTKKAGSAILINIDKTKQKMAVFVDGVEKYDWPVSTGKAGYSTPSGAYTATSMNEVWYSKQYDNAPMPHSVFFMKDGHAIHGSYDVKNLGKPLSHGCVRISPENAATLYALVAKNGLENTQVVLTGATPGGEYKVASPARPGSRYSQATYGRYKPGDNYYTQPQTRLSFFGDGFSGPSYNGAQTYYGPTPVYYQPRGY